jgi:hypothetical protein
VFSSSNAPTTPSGASACKPASSSGRRITLALCNRNPAALFLKNRRCPFCSLKCRYWVWKTDEGRMSWDVGSFPLGLDNIDMCTFRVRSSPDFADM